MVVLGPGPGDPRDPADPRIAALGRCAAHRLDRGLPLLGVCLGHQVLAARLGLPVRRLAVPHQGTQQEVELFGRRRLVGFYNSFAAVAGDTRPGVPGLEVSADPVTGLVHGLRGPGFVGLQFHAESVLTTEGPQVLAEELSRLARG